MRACLDEARRRRPHGDDRDAGARARPDALARSRGGGPGGVRVDADARAAPLRGAVRRRPRGAGAAARPRPRRRAPLSGKIDRIDVDPFGARGIVQDYKSGKHAHSAREIESELRLQIPLYMLVLRDLVGLEPLGGVYRPLAGERKPRGLLRAADADTLPGLREERLLRRGRVLGRGRERAREGRASSPSGSAPATSGTTPRAASARHGATSGRCAESSGLMNEQQLAAVEATGEVFVSAGAGTGKTAVLVERFVRAVCERGLDVDSILVITYTRRAAGELRTRIRAALAERGRPDLARELDGAWISTIHGFCNRLLKSVPVRGRARPALPRARRRPGRRAPRRGVPRRRSPSSAPPATQTGCACSRRTAPRGCGGCSPASTRRSAPPGASSTSPSAGDPELAERVEELREAARCLADDAAATETQQRHASELLELLARDDAPRPADGPRRLPARRRAGGRLRRGAGARSSRPRSTPRRRATATCCRSSSTGFAAALRGGEGARVGARLRGPPARRARPAARRRGDPRPRAAALPLDHGRRVPGHEPAPDRPRRPPARRRDGALLRRRRVPVDLRLPARRRRASSASGAPPPSSCCR